MRIWSLSQDATDKAYVKCHQEGRTITTPSKDSGRWIGRCNGYSCRVWVKLAVTTQKGLAILARAIAAPELRGNRSMVKNSYTAIVEKEGDLYVALCPELDVASQGATIEGATSNLKEAVELFLETADAAEIKHRLHSEVFITRFEAAHG